MPAKILDGKEIAKSVRIALRPRIAALKEAGVLPTLAVILVGDDPASQIYVRNKHRMCERLEMGSRVIVMDADTTQEQLLALVRELNADDSVHGILVQAPLPKGLNEEEVNNTIDPNKDVDGFHPLNAGKLAIGSDGIVPGTPRGVMEMLRAADVQLEGAHAVVVGRSNIVGKPMAQLLLQANCTVTVAHSRTRNLAEITRQADVLVAAVGKPAFIKADMVKEGAAVIDVGINRVGDQILGDVDYEPVAEIASAITPVPGGVGPMTIAMLMKSTVEAAERFAKAKKA